VSGRGRWQLADCLIWDGAGAQQVATLLGEALERWTPAERTRLLAPARHRVAELNALAAEHRAGRAPAVEWVSVSEAARRWDMNPRTVRRAIEEGRILAKRDGHRWLVDANARSGRQLPSLGALSPT
jgi:hypothetical protein